MKITVINGQNHKGSTYRIGKMLTDKLGGEVTEFFVPKDFHEFCVGCIQCLKKSEDKCPHYKELEKIVKAIDEADVLVFTSPVYVYHVTGAMKSLLDHFAYRWMIHRPEKSMFTKQAVIITTAAGAGTKSAIKDIKHSLSYWGVSKIYSFGVALFSESYDTASDKVKNKTEKFVSKTAWQIKKNDGRVKPSIKTKLMFSLFKRITGNGITEVDSSYWKQNGWTDGKKPW